METRTQSTPKEFKEKFEINDKEFRELTIDSNRMIATGRSWKRFELLITFIGASWMEKWRRFSLKLLGLGIALIILGLFGPYAFLFLYLLIPFELRVFLSTIIFVLGIGIIVVWAVAKKEALMLYTSAGAFKIEGSAGFVDSLWRGVSQILRERDL